MTNSPGDSVVLTIRNEDVTQLQFDFAFSIVTSGSLIRIETPFRLTNDDAHTGGTRTWVIDPEGSDRPVELLRLRHLSLDADCFESGALSLKFLNGSTIDVWVDQRFEAWSLTRQNGEMVVSLPGGGVATFEARR
ncbi:DUF6188 family protein [Herbiconiux sp. VKM Ac-2851]|uniref:DUF6188 family protein n=1 Tax=Herbiconiux sp. VKM Ac-2851 TaxID=2739025 RepID=UPI0015652CC5|nr:hypothetical protein [Herbiconiux sp. VKM Ac-2851]